MKKGFFKQIEKKHYAELNECARLIYSTMGCEVKKGYDFKNAKHPQEIMCYTIALETCCYWKVNRLKRERV